MIEINLQYTSIQVYGIIKEKSSDERMSLETGGIKHDRASDLHPIAQDCWRSPF